MEDVDIDAQRILIDRIEQIGRSFVSNAPNILVAIIFIALTWAAAWAITRLAHRLFGRSGTRPALAEGLVGLIRVTIWLVGLLIAAMIALPNLSPSDIVAGLGIGAIAIGLAFRDIFENFLAGLLILLRKPMRIGDFIECESIEGEVKRISLRDTYIRRTDGVLAMTPNSYLFKNPVQVLTDLPDRRQRLIVGVAYDASIDAARDALTEAMDGLERVRSERPVQVFAREFSASSIDFEVVWWSGSKPVDVRRSRDEVVGAVKVALDKAGIEIPFPQRTLTFGEAVPVVSEADDD